MWSTKCPVGEVSFGELHVRGNVCRGTFRRGSDSRGIVLGEVSIGELSSRGTVRIPLTTAIIYDYCNLVVKIDLFTSIYFLQILIKP